MTRPNPLTSVYLDANVLIAVITKQTGYEPAAEVLRLADQGKLQVMISALSYVEVRSGGHSGPIDAAKEQQCLDILDSPKLVRVDFNRRLAMRARRYAYAHALKNYDAIHLASAVEGGAEALMSWDRSLRRLGSVEGVWCDEPYDPGGPNLFNT